MIIPALDLIKGNVVRLYQGNYHKKINYKINPLIYIKKYIEQDAEIINLIDLDGTQDPNKRQINLLKNLLGSINIVTQIGGGIRTSHDIEILLNAGATRVIIGSMAVQNFEEVKTWFINFGSEHIVLAVDIKIDANNFKRVATNGWQRISKINLEYIIEKFKSVGLQHVLCTDIDRDGTLIGPNIKLYQEITTKFPDITFQASGGISSLNDVALLRNSGVKSVVIGRALLEDKFTFSEAKRCWQKE
ncbi:1-(5-phosphoribosyl)-5-[(5-phosphoribosylamino)methylideneamino]imidazole-4-carboxamide isomerase [Candidatus Pantoea edessiphila]|uniref:1-(5-phosphoribosyl)-5-[(5-phosphoribosylamino)methylideneamino] imidazole-4-carboxamide isomerase n=1 Tax=Candidatus Pantoea edessiphila TaxID=2044610 RepID=A0A2P5SYK5_9GAMM|nr:1-(5-phosphoribosyl)-5-[(5-phosphoribosylamino)methylideneamino]imidazole-4-carboxamide isomerase [Candidatus Pantoea edessiphila]MBK4775457.1 1-(5-phosphoribosyl)-5-[(5-phosphoribosylamino)methylideneamino]imidazole-4-carboxamide isomerase [Pantoea sp. Edef]PPI87416.1 1-(5-phosphoribosyl)-5-[(5-phosphoribosylamino)methylideneamino]imidazole-4-carboxamide isomerase [Candidatus Pantoea edessiphila]